MNKLLKAKTKTLLRLRRVFNILSLIFLAVIPGVIVALKYNLLNTKTGNKISGWIFVFALIIIVPTLKFIERLIGEMPDIKIYGKHKGYFNTAKYILYTIKKLLFPIICVIVIFLFKDNVELAFQTFGYVLMSMTCSMIIEGMLIKPMNYLISLDVENAKLDARDIRKQANA